MNDDKSAIVEVDMLLLKPFKAALILLAFMLNRSHAAADSAVFPCREETLQQFLELNPTPQRMRDVPVLDPTPRFAFQINVQMGKVERVFYHLSNDIKDMTENLTIHSVVRNDDGATRDDGTLNFLLTVERSDKKETVVDTFTVSVYGRTGTGAFLLSSTKLSSRVRATISFTGRCTGLPISLFRLGERER